MDLSRNLPQTAEAYMASFRTLAALTDAALDHVEHNASNLSDDDQQKINSRIADAIRTIAALRGDSDAFTAARPQGLSEYQKEMYAIEDQLYARLSRLGYTPVREA